jgi:methylmalonyl-CoA mutase N-terminal domain/subunit
MNSFYLLFMGTGNRATRDLELIDQRGAAIQASSDGFQTERIEQTRGKFKKYQIILA